MNDAQVFNCSSFPEDTDMYPMSNIEQIERTFCTNFSCCNIVFPDLHALLDHYDTTTAGAHAIYSTPRTPVSSCSSPSPSFPSFPSSPTSCSPSSCSSAPSSPESPNAPPYTLWPTPVPLLPHLHVVAPDGCTGTGTSDVPASPLYVYHHHHHLPDAYAFSEYPTYEHCYRAATTALAAPHSQSQSQSPLGALLFADAPLLYPHSQSQSHSPLSSGPSSPSPSPNSTLPHSAPKSTSRSNSKSQSKSKSKLRPKSKSGRLAHPSRCPPASSSSPPYPELALALASTETGTETESLGLALYAHAHPRKTGTGTGMGTGKGKRRGKVDLDGVPLAAARRRARKAYHCPTPGCTKSYLNPNGLKYHQEKGTCKIEGVSVVSAPVPLLGDSVVTTTAATTAATPANANANATADAHGHANADGTVPLPDLAPSTPMKEVPPPPDAEHHPHQHQYIHQPQPRQLHQGSVDMLEQWWSVEDGGEPYQVVGIGIE